MKQYLANYYDSTYQYYGAYHDHKEICAWAGLALHLLFCGLILSADTPEKHNILATLGFTVMLLLVVLFVFLYVQNQLTMKDRGGALAGAAQYLLSEILMKKDEELNPEHYLRITESEDTKAQSSHVVPDCLRYKANIINTRGRGYQDKTKSMIYTLLGLSTLFSIIVKWIVA